MNRDLKVLEVIESFRIEGEVSTFSKPQGLFITEDEQLLVSDTGNARVVVLDQQRICQRLYTTPVHKLIPNDYEFKPVSVAMDTSQRVYVVSKGDNQGILEFDKQGDFRGYIGAIEVAAPDFFTALWKSLMSQEQLSRVESWIPTEYNNIDIDNNGFIFGVVSAIDDPYNFVRKLNPMGVNVLVQDNQRPVSGDLFYSTTNGEKQTSKIVDICTTEYGIYSILDERKGRIFTYDGLGNQLFVFGSIGDSFGSVAQPVAIETDSERCIYVLDAQYNHIVVYRPTEYAQKIYSAVVSLSKRQYQQSREAWIQVMQYSINSDMPYISMGKVLMQQKNYKEAMKYFEMVQSTDYYGEAYKLYRQEVMRNLFPFLILGGLGVIIVVFLVLKRKKYSVL